LITVYIRNITNYITFAKELKDFPAFSLRDTEKLSGRVYYHRIAEWQKKGYIKRIANGIFIFAGEPMDEMHLYYLANRIYEPSYISLESAFAHYGFIPEAVYRITSVCSKKTSQFQQDNIVFTYRTINPRFNFGYTLMKWKNVAIKIAEPEKAVIDYFYLNTELNTPDQIEGMRFNTNAIKGQIDWQKINKYLEIYDNKTLIKRILLLKELVNNA
jgi:predicted transcriptional regulator of viral defense system